jgi:tRNA threonylcarbamoyl adenosine modification protein YeaZ
MFLLAIETSSSRGSLALFEGRSLIARVLFPEGLVHGREVTARLKDVMAERGLPPAALGAVAVGLGPGSYTGIRVGVTAAKSLAFALRIPAVGESSLRVMAANALGSPDGGCSSGTDTPSRRSSGGEALVTTAVDGKQRHIYLALFRVRPPGPGAPGSVERLEDDRVVRDPGARAAEGTVLSPLGPAPSPLGPPEGTSEGTGAPTHDFGKVLPRGAFVVGDAADLVLKTAGEAGLVRGPADWDRPDAAALGVLVAGAIEDERPRFDPEAVHGMVPIYLRPSEAEVKYGAALSGNRSGRGRGRAAAGEGGAS